MFCGATFKPNLLNVKVNGRASQSIRDKRESVCGTMRGISTLARGRLSKLKWWLWCSKLA